MGFLILMTHKKISDSFVTKLYIFVKYLVIIGFKNIYYKF